VVRVEANPVPPTREVALLVNPVATHGIDVVDAIATRRPDIPLVLQESWPLDPQQQAVVDDLVTRHRNVVFRAYEPDAGRILRDARIVLAPHRVDNRPRTVLEAQVNAVPVVATDHPGLVEAVGYGGLLIGRDAGGDVWAEQVGALWDDTERLRDLGDAAVRHAARDEIRPDRVVDHFEQLIDTLVSGVPA
jgi:glycosyltransferase involved in cell wall biosynthesis